MEDKIKEMLDEEIESEFDNLATLTPGSEEHTRAVKALGDLYKLRIEETKNYRDHKEQRDVRTNEEQFRCDQLKEQKRNNYIRYGLETAGLILPLIFYGVWMKRGFKFEETGTFTSPTFRGLFQKFRPTK